MARILIIDDSNEVRSLVGKFLTAKGFEVIVAAGGSEGLSHAAEMRPDLVLMDLNMPGLNGFDATRRIKEDAALKHIPVLALSGEAETGNRDAIYEAGCDGFIPKPIDFPNLVSTIEKHLDG